MGKFLKDISKNKVISIALISSLAVGCVIILIGMSFYKNKIAGIASADTANYHKYQYHYAIISEESDAPFWEDIYQGALKKGEELDIYVEKIGNNLQASYHLADLLKIAIAAKVDGIIIEPDGTEEVAGLINQAEEEGIPVITVLKDAPESNRISFVGINSYNQGLTYGKQVLEVVREGKTKVTVLQNSNSKDASQSAIYSNISEAVAHMGVELETAAVNTQSTFSAEEDIRDIIMSVDPPEVLVCLPAIDTVTAYQTLVDYNKLNDITIIGFYDSDLILRAIEMGNIHSTMTIDAKQMGAYCVEALGEFKKNGQVSDYFSVDISIINRSNVKEYMESKEQDREAEQ
jgi:ribose transport system substrate-binding protein